MSENNLPFEISTEKAKAEIITAISQAGQKYSLPSGVLLLLLDIIASEVKTATYETILESYDIIPKTAPKQDAPSPNSTLDIPKSE